jgi:hypothetical protein
MVHPPAVRSPVRRQTLVGFVAVVVATLAWTATPAAATVAQRTPSGCSTVDGCGSRTAVPARLALPLARSFGHLSTANWAGYAGHGSGFTSVHAVWRVPPLACARVSTASFVAEWAGIDGLDTNTLIQAGVDARCDSPGARPWYRLFYELLPEPETAVPNGAVRAGDVVVTDIRLTPGTNRWSVRLVVNGVVRFGAVLKYSTGRTSAECIVEAPVGIGGGVRPLADYGTARFTDCSAARAGAPRGRELGAGSGGDFSVYRIDDDLRGVKQTTGAPSANGSTWTTTWRAA